MSQPAPVPPKLGICFIHSQQQQIYSESHSQSLHWINKSSLSAVCRPRPMPKFPLPNFSVYAEADRNLDTETVWSIGQHRAWVRLHRVLTVRFFLRIWSTISTTLKQCLNWNLIETYSSATGNRSYLMYS